MPDDDVLAAVSGCLIEVFRGALEARRIGAGADRFSASWRGEWHAAGKELAAIHLRLHLLAEERHRPTVERVVSFYAAHCPLRKKLAPRARVVSELIFEALPSATAPAPRRAS